MEKLLKLSSNAPVLKNKVKRFFGIGHAKSENLIYVFNVESDMALSNIWDLTLQLYDFVKDIPFEDRKNFLIENLPKNADEYIIDYILDAIEIIERENLKLASSEDKTKIKEKDTLFFPTIED